MKFFLVALFAAVVCTASADSILKELLTQAKDLKHDMDKVVVGKIKCHVDAITESVKGTDLEQKWTAVADQVKVLTENIVKCVKDHPHKPLEAAKCVAQEATKVRTIVKEFVDKAKSDNSEVYNKIKEAIKKC